MSFDAAELFGVEELTIKRDLQELRSMGIDIHSQRGQGIHILRPLTAEKIQILVHQYFAFCNEQSFWDSTMTRFIYKLRMHPLRLLVSIQRGIESGTALDIKFTDNDSVQTRHSVLNPVRILRTANQWFVMSYTEAQFKLIELHSITDATPTTHKFEKSSPEAFIDALQRFCDNDLSSEFFPGANTCYTPSGGLNALPPPSYPGRSKPIQNTNSSINEKKTDYRHR